jgi:ubiquinone/menaquinone biosynthesis C-methylase UbiE
MITDSVFDTHAQEYDAWFERHQALYQSELLALRELVPASGKGVEIGVGSGRFAEPLDITTGVEPSAAMAVLARLRGIQVTEAIAEALPFQDQTFDYAVFVTTLCFVDSVSAALAEAYRIIRPGGSIIIGLINKDSELGKQYESKKQQSIYYRDAQFVEIEYVTAVLTDLGFVELIWRQTLFAGLAEDEIQVSEPGYSSGGFVIVKAIRPAG